jgi:ATP/maltotriose-dependent transcriptional regulator MalT
MLETIREYGLETLAVSGELEAVRQAHARYYLALAEEAESTLEGLQQAVRLERLEQEHENLRAALSWLLERSEAGQGTGIDGEMALRFGVALRRFWNIRGHWSEGRTFLERTLATSEGSTSALRAKARIATASLAISQHDMERGEALCRESLVQSRERGDTEGTAFSLYLLSWIAWTRGELATARALIEESLVLERELDDKGGISYTLGYLGDLASQQGEYARAQALLEESLIIDRELGNERGIALSLQGVARTLFVSQGDPATVCTLLEESLALYKKLGDKMGIAYGLSLSALVALQQGDVSTARRLAEESVLLSRETEALFETIWSLAVLARVETHQGEQPAARTHYKEGLAMASKMGIKLHIPFLLEGLANLLAARGEPARAAQFWGAAEALRESMGLPIWPVERVAYEHTVEGVRAQLGEQAFAAAWTQGRIMSPEQVLVAQRREIIKTLPANQLLTSPMKSSPTYPDGLTAREVEVLRLVAQGLTDAQVAEQLVISPHTVNAHLKSIYGKIRVSSRNAATRYALEHQLL